MQSGGKDMRASMAMMVRDFPSTIDTYFRYLQVIQSIDSEMCELVDSQTTHLKTLQTLDIKLSLDWGSQLHKIKSVPVNFEKTPELTLTFIGFIGLYICTSYHTLSDMFRPWPFSNTQDLSL